MPNAKIGKHGEIVIKNKLRKKYNIDPGQEVLQFDAGDHIAIIPLSRNPFECLNGKYNWERPLKILKKNLEKLALDDFNIV